MEQKSEALGALLEVHKTNPAMAEQFVTNAALRSEVIAKLHELELRESALLDAVIDSTVY